MPKYENYQQLADAFKSGELNEHYYLMLDKGGTENGLNYYNEDESDEEIERKQDECADWFECPEIEEAFTAMGIRWQWC